MKKAQMGLKEMGVTAIILFLIVIILTTVGSTIVSQMTSTLDATTETAYTQQATGVNGTAVTLDKTRIDITQFAMKNASGGAVVDVSNYSITAGDTLTLGTLTIDAREARWNVALNLSYNYTQSDKGYDYNVTVQGNKGLLNFAGFNPVIGTVLAAALIISLLMVAFAGFKQQ